MTWNSIFKEELNGHGSLLAHYTGCLVQNWHFVRKVKQYLSNNKSSYILEAGAGTGFLAIYLSSLGYKVSAMDIDTHFIEGARVSLKSDISIIQQDIRILTDRPSRHFDLIYNIGVMEHFNDGDIVKIFKDFRSLANVFIFAVPNFKIPCSYGNERYLSKGHWQRFLKGAGWRIKETFSYNRYGLRKYLSGFVCEHKS